MQVHNTSVLTMGFQIASRELGVPINLIYTSETGTGTIPLPPASAGSVTTDIYGPAVMVRSICIKVLQEFALLQNVRL